MFKVCFIYDGISSQEITQRIKNKVTINNFFEPFWMRVYCLAQVNENIDFSNEILNERKTLENHKVCGPTGTKSVSVNEQMSHRINSTIK